MDLRRRLLGHSWAQLVLTFAVVVLGWVLGAFVGSLLAVRLARGAGLLLAGQAERLGQLVRQRRAGRKRRTRSSARAARWKRWRFSSRSRTC